MNLPVIIRAGYTKYRNLVLYGIIGIISSGLDFVIYSFLTYVNIYYLYANIISIGCGILTSFLLNRHYNFRIKDQMLKRFLLFLMIGMLGLLLSTFILYTMIQTFQQNVLLSKLLAIVLVALVQFVLNKLITFRQANHLTA